MLRSNLTILGQAKKSERLDREKKTREADHVDSDKTPIKIDRDTFILQQKADLVAFIADLDAKQKADFDVFIETQAVIQKAALVDFNAKQSAEKKAALDSYAAHQVVMLDVFDQSQRDNIKKEDDEDEEEKINLPILRKSDFICPLTQEPIIYPIVVRPCGHLFEEKAINNWIAQEEHAKDEALCPLCREIIQKAHPPTEHFFNKLHKELLEKNPTLGLVTFSLSFLNSCLQMCDAKKSANHQLKILVDLLKKSPELMNTASNEEGFEGYTPVNLLTAYPTGLRLLPRLRKNILPAGLNAIGNDGISAVFRLISNSEAIQGIDSELCGKITPEALNAVVRQPGKKSNGTTAVNFLAWRFASKVGRNLLAEFPALCNLFRPQGLNAIAIENGEERGDSAVYWFAASMKEHDFFTTTILDMITEASFNATRPGGSSALYFFTRFEKGRQLLLNNPRLCALMTKEALLTKPQSFELGFYDFKRKTPAEWLTHTITGQKILARNPDLQKKIGYSFNVKRLNELLYHYKDDNNQEELDLMIAFLKDSKEVMNQKDQNYYGLTTTHVLVSHEKGLDLLLANPELRDMIQSDGLNAVCEMKKKPKGSFPWFNQDINYYSLSAVYWLMKSKKGREILLADNARLFSLITSEAFYRAIETEALDIGKITPFSWLECNSELQELYKDRADLLLSRQVKP